VVTQGRDSYREGQSSSPAAPEALAGDCATQQERGNNKADAGGFQWPLQAATSSYPLERSGCAGELGRSSWLLAYLLLRPRPLAGDSVQPERVYNEAGAGRVPAIKRRLVLVSF
jgi:hypothetical protein